MLEVRKIKERLRQEMEREGAEAFFDRTNGRAVFQERIEDLKDLRDLQAGIAENGDKPLIPWERVKAELELD